jgi:transaldolase
MSTLKKLAAEGQSVWLDYIRRSILDSGELSDLVKAGVRGVTSNPAIFEKAIAGTADYDDDVRKLAMEGRSVEEIYESLAIADIRAAADILADVHEDTGGEDGFVSLEVNPAHAHATEETVAEAERFFARVNRHNVMIKVPGTSDGIPAVERLTAGGINVNVTLLFSLAQYEAVTQAYLAGLEKRLAAGSPLSHVHSVASFFVSRVDTAVDKELEKKGVRDLQGKIAVDNARRVYERFVAIFSGPRWERLARAGAKVQRPLWASTGTKNPAYPDTLYVDTLIGPHTVNTMPPDTLKAFLDHGTVRRTVDEDLAGGRERLARLASLGIDLDAVTARLLAEGVKAFEDPFASLMASLAAKREKILAEKRG